MPAAPNRTIPEDFSSDSLSFSARIPTFATSLNATIEGLNSRMPLEIENVVSESAVGESDFGRIEVYSLATTDVLSASQITGSNLGITGKVPLRILDVISESIVEDMTFEALRITLEVIDVETESIVKRVSVDGWNYTEDLGNVLEHILSDLDSGTHYEVQARSSEGEVLGEWSSSVYGATFHFDIIDVKSGAKVTQVQVTANVYEFPEDETIPGVWGTDDDEQWVTVDVEWTSGVMKADSVVSESEVGTVDILGWRMIFVDDVVSEAEVKAVSVTCDDEWTTDNDIQWAIDSDGWHGE